MECPECGGPMRRTIIHEIESWECPVDGYAFDAEQSVDKCAWCGKAEASHVYREGEAFHMFIDEATQTRRVAAAKATNERIRRASHV